MLNDFLVSLFLLEQLTWSGEDHKAMFSSQHFISHKYNVLIISFHWLILDWLLKF